MPCRAQGGAFPGGKVKDAPDQIFAHLFPLGWEHVTLSHDEQRVFGETARTLRFGNAERRTEAPITAE